MFQNLKRILMNEADAGGGNGAAVPATPAEPVSVPQAQGDTVTISKADLAALVAAEATKAVTAVKDSIYAEARRTFTGSKEKKPKTDDPAPTTAAPMSATEERSYLRGLDRYIATKGLKPTASQYERAERALLGERPENVEAWASDYFDGYGGAQTSTQPVQAQTAPAPKPVSEHPISNRGAPPPAQTPIEEMDLWTATDSDRAAFARTKGVKAYVDTLKKQGKGRPVRIR